MTSGFEDFEARTKAAATHVPTLPPRQARSEYAPTPTLNQVFNRDTPSGVWPYYPQSANLPTFDYAEYMDCHHPPPGRGNPPTQSAELYSQDASPATAVDPTLERPFPIVEMTSPAGITFTQDMSPPYQGSQLQPNNIAPFADSPYPMTMEPQERHAFGPVRSVKSISDIRSKSAGISRLARGGLPPPLTLGTPSTCPLPIRPTAQPSYPVVGKTAKAEAANLEKLQKEYGRLASNAKLNQEVIAHLRSMIGHEPSKDLWLIVFLLKAQHVLLPRAMSCKLCQKNGEICLVPGDSRMKPGPNAGGGITCRCCTAAHVPCDWSGAPSLRTKEEKRHFRAKQVEIASRVSRGLAVKRADWIAVGGQGPVEAVPSLHLEDARFIYNWLETTSATLREVRSHVLLLMRFDMERLAPFSTPTINSVGPTADGTSQLVPLPSPSTGSETDLESPVEELLSSLKSPQLTVNGEAGPCPPSSSSQSSTTPAAVTTPLNPVAFDDSLWLLYGSGSNIVKKTSPFLNPYHGGEVPLASGPLTPVRQEFCAQAPPNNGPSPWRSGAPSAYCGVCRHVLEAGSGVCFPCAGLVSSADLTSSRVEAPSDPFQKPSPLNPNNNEFRS